MNDSAMVRHHYGPWDPRYYQVLAYLEGRELITVEKEKKTFIFGLTDAGAQLARELASAPAYSDLVLHMRKVRGLFGGKSGDWLKKLVYRVFDNGVLQHTGTCHIFSYTDDGDDVPADKRDADLFVDDEGDYFFGVVVNEGAGRAYFVERDQVEDYIMGA
jgi:hypothetical protein